METFNGLTVGQDVFVNVAGGKVHGTIMQLSPVQGEPREAYIKISARPVDVSERLKKEKAARIKDMQEMVQFLEEARVILEKMMVTTPAVLATRERLFAQFARETRVFKGSLAVLGYV